MIKKYVFLLLLLLTQTVSAVTTTFTADPVTVYPNPEKGFYILAGDMISNSNFDASLVAIRDTYGFRLAFANTQLPTSNLTAPQLAAITASFAMARNRGMKLILRFQYGTTANDPVLAQIQAHTIQLKPLLAANQDVIYVVQGGFIGQYGEWADSANNNDTKAGKRAVKDYLLAMVPTAIPINITQLYPTMEDWFAGLPALDASIAFTGKSQARIGAHSDCYLTGNGDSFFYTGPATVKDFVITSSRVQQRAYMAAISKYTPFGGETCNNSQGASVQQRVNCIDSNDETGQSGGILNEGPRYNLSYQNYSFAPNFIAAWTSGGCLNTVKNKIGYQFQYDSIIHDALATKGTNTIFYVSMRNIGWGRIWSQRRLSVIIKPSSGADIECKSASQLRELASQATNTTTIKITCAIPSNTAVGAATLYLKMPDDHSTLSSIRAYMIRPANANNGSQVWDDTLGRFQVSGSGALTIN